jgi:hypothetical protein
VICSPHVCFNNVFLPFLACYRTLRDSEVRAISRRVAVARKDLSVAEVGRLFIMYQNVYDQ